MITGMEHMELNTHIMNTTKKTFFLTDLMKTGDHLRIEQFLNLCTLPQEQIRYSGEYYTLHDRDLTQYDRLYAMIDHRKENIRLWNSTEYWEEFSRRIKILKQKDFQFIIAQPWESEENLHKTQHHKPFLSDTKYCTWSGGVNWFWFLMYEKHKDKKYNFNHTDKKYDFLYLNKQSRTHRKQLFDALQKQSLLDNSLISFLDPPYNIKLNRAYELPWVNTGNYPRYGSDQDIYEPQFNDCAFNLVSETNDNNHDVFITEKLWKPIIAQQIFVVHGNFGYLKKLREMGFRTFDSVFDESYDQELDPAKRIEKLVSLCRHLRTVDKSKIYQETADIRQHNYNLFFNKGALSDSINDEFFKPLFETY
jgi:hypothetical protein